MNRLIAALFLLSANCLFAQQKPNFLRGKIIIDGNFKDKLFEADKHAKLSFVTTSVTMDEKNSVKKDSVQNVPNEIDIIKNCSIVDSEDPHNFFDFCESMFRKDTLVIQFKNNRSLLPTFGYHDKIFIYIIKSGYYIEYIPQICHLD
ncbi:MAG TPA: hypothetical protein VK543_18065 [Puia sp.]|nr:hypothetical protein [Puia sp.]